MPSKIRGGTKDKHLADMHIPRVSALGAGGGAAAGPTTLILDQFTDTNGTAIGSHTIAPTNTPATSWSATAGSLDIQSNRANGVSVAVFHFLAVCDPGIANYAVSVIANIGAGRYGGPVARYLDTSNFWHLQIAETENTVALVEVTTGNTYTERASASVTIDASTDYTIGLTVSGTNISSTLNGGNALAYSSSTHQANTKAGVRGGISATVIRFDNFTVTTV